MYLGELRKHIKSLPKGTKFKYSLSEPFSWRGSYCEVAFSVEEVESTREELLKKIRAAFTKKFYGYKGGEYRFDEFTTINFESEKRSWSDGEYTEKCISDVMGVEEVKTPEARLINLLFPTELTSLPNNRFISVDEQTPPLSIELLAKSPEGVVYITHWRPAYSIFTCQEKTESYDGWVWKLIGE